MTYAVFNSERNNGSDELINTLSLLLFTPKSSFKDYGASISNSFRKELKSTKTEVLAGYVACWEAKKHSVAIIKFKEDLDSDKYLMQFGGEYLGCINEKLSKNELIDRIELIHTLHYNKELEGWLSVQVKDLQAKLKTTLQLNDDEITELKEIQMKSKNPYSKWISDREKRLKKSLDKYPKFLIRQF
jgi:hypothetical protein